MHGPKSSCLSCRTTSQTLRVQFRVLRWAKNWLQGIRVATWDAVPKILFLDGSKTKLPRATQTWLPTTETSMASC